MISRFTEIENKTTENNPCPLDTSLYTYKISDFLGKYHVTIARAENKSVYTLNILRSRELHCWRFPYKKCTVFVIKFTKKQTNKKKQKQNNNKKRIEDLACGNRATTKAGTADSSIRRIKGLLYCT